MASVHYLLEDIDAFRTNLYNKIRLSRSSQRKRVLAAIVIQCHWRGYCVRKQKARMTVAAVKIQTAYRGWIVRWKMTKYLADYIEARNNRLFNKMATRIGVLWRGYWARKNLPDNKNMVKRRQLRELMEKEDKKTKELMKEFLNRLQHGPKSKEQIAEEEDQCKRWVLYIIHKCHHLLRTTHIPGIYSNNNAEGDLTFVEQLMKSLPMREYMDNIRKLYNEMQKQEPPKTPYIYEERAIRKMEDAFKLRYKLNDVKSVTAFNFDRHFEQKPFVVQTRIPEKPYKKMLAYENEPYKHLKPIQRISNAELNISKHDFVLSKKVVKKEADVPPYYIDNCYKPKCNRHYPLNINGEY